MWSSWGSCPAVCGSGLQYRSRSITKRASCGGSSCPSTTDAKSCFEKRVVPCQVSGWSEWTACSNLCGKGSQIRSRLVTVKAKCGGSCPSLSETRSCTSIASSRNCNVNSWSKFGSCTQNCGVGRQYRYRTVSQPHACTGRPCPVLTDSQTCGQTNGGCQQLCSSGMCSCHSGYLLSFDKKTCQPRSCGTPSIKYCPSGTTYGTTCKYPAFSCSAHTYQKACNVSCATGYELKDGPSTIICLSSGTWTTHKTAYCRRKNEPPSKVSLSSNTVNENVAVGTVVGTLATSDPNPTDSHVYALLVDAGSKFTLRGNILKISFSPDYETQPHLYSIKVRSTDKGGLYHNETFTVSVNNLNEAPEKVTLSKSSVNENVAKGTFIGSLTTVDPESSQTHTYKLMDSAGGRFVLSGRDVKVAVTNSRCLAEGGRQCLLNYEASSSHNIVVRSTDNGKPQLYKDFTLTITVGDVNDQPRNLYLSGYTLQEDKPAGTVIGKLSSTDEDWGQTLTYTLTDNATGRFAISKTNQVVRKTSSGIDYETTSSYKITVVVTDSGKPPLKLSKVFTIEVLNVNEAPVSIDFTSVGGQLSFSDNKPRVKENSIKGTVVGTLEAHDADATQTLTFKLDDTAGGRFSVDAKKVTCTTGTKVNAHTKCTVVVIVAGTLNHEQDALHTIVIRVTDQHGLFQTSKIPVTVVDVNDRPRDIVFSGKQLSIEENKNNALIGVFSSTDDDPANTHKYSLVNSSGGRFVISGSKLLTATNANLNYEATGQLSIVVRSTDTGTPPLSVDKAFTVQVTDVNEAPTRVWLSSTKVDENSGMDTTIGSLQTADPDSERRRQIKTRVQTHSYTLLDSAQGRFKLEKGILKVAVSNTKCLAFGGTECKLNYEKSKTYRLVVRSTDSGAPPLQKDSVVTVFLNDVNDKPRSLTIDNFKVKENSPKGTLVGRLNASDEDSGQKLTYTLTNSDNSKFYLKDNQLLKASSADYETKAKHLVTVKVTDNGKSPLWISKEFVIEVLNVNEPPVSIVFKDTNSKQTFTDNFPKVNENEAAGTLIGTVEGHDEDTNQKLTMTLDDDGGGRFSISSASAVVCSSTSKITGVNTVCSAKIYVAGTLNHEVTNRHTIIVRATDTGGLFVATKFTISVLDVNDPPRDIQLASGNPQVRENDNNGVVGELITTDDDTTQTHAYKLLDGAAGCFVIVGREVKVSAKAILNYETAQQYTIRVMSTDSGTPPLSKTKSFTIKILDVNEKPTSVYISSDLVKENSPINTVVGSLTTSDPDNLHKARQTFSYRIVDSANGRFKVDGDVVKVNVPNTRCLALGGNNCVLNFENKDQHVITVRATDNGSTPLYVDYPITIHVQDVNDQPRSLDLSHNKVLENMPAGTVVGNLSSTDEDSRQTTTYTLTDDDNGMFKIFNDELQKATSANYETMKAHSVVVMAVDDGSPPLQVSKRFTIGVLNVNEAPISISFTDTDGQLSFSDNVPCVQENSPKATIVGTIEALDYDANETLVFRLDDDSNGMFALRDSADLYCKTLQNNKGINTYCSTTVLVVGPLNYEGKEKHYVEIRVSDKEGLFHVQRFKIDIIDINDVPHDVELNGRKIKENFNDVVIGQFTTKDQDATDSHIYTLVDNAGGRFVIKNDRLFTSQTANLDYESQLEYNITVQSNDDGIPPLFVDETYVIMVLDANEPPSLIEISNLQIRENSPSETVVGLLIVSDPDNCGPKGVWQTHNCSTRQTSDGRFTIDNNVVKVAKSDINYESNSSLSIVVHCVDTGSPQQYRDELLVISVVDVNENPISLTMTGGVIAENSSPQALASFTTTDPDNEFTLRQNFTYTLLTAQPSFPFVINGNVLETVRRLNYEAQQSWQLTVHTTDNGGLSISEAFQVNVTDVNDPPSAINVAGTVSVPENSMAATFAGQLQTMDDDYGQSHVYRIEAVSAGFDHHFLVPKMYFECICSRLDMQRVSADLLSVFSLNAANGELAVGAKELLDYEAISAYTIQIVSTDSGTPPYSLSGTVTVNVLDVNEAPSNVTLSGNEIVEGSIVNSTVGHLTVSDPDNELGLIQTHRCVVLDSDHQPFKVIDNRTLVVSQATLNYEQEEFYYLGVRCYDDGHPQMYVEASFTIQVLNTNEAPSQVGLTSYTIDENKDPGFLVGIAMSIDPDNEQSWVQNVTFRIEEGALVPFAMINDTDIVSMISFDFENQSRYVFHLMAIDDGLPPQHTSQKIEIHIIDINDQPRYVGLNSSGVDENSPDGTVVGNLYTIDEDRFQSHVYSIIPQYGVSGLFAINGDQLVVASGTNLDHEEETTHSIVIMTTDNGSPQLTYQRTDKTGVFGRVPLQNMHIIDVRLKRVAVELVGPISPPSDGGHRYPTLFDYATRYPEAIPIKNIDTKTVAEALVDIHIRLGIPEEVLSDLGRQFVSDCLKEVSRLLRISLLASTPYHLMCNGLVDIFNGTVY
ncbi:protocadherin Fat 4-like isoform X3 [Corticium candelabrum]|uniref:protocadherin Fat 4-like isoform X3 n=1 Tax=Corticium candelabrum TaxID=121492 RepID=UPI002E25BCD6|nr:protocadherin Fat 4-like isoform X3 [Corticium candelabrum]